MEKIVERNLLYDFYGEFLTEHQKHIYEDAAYGDLSLSELAESYNITRQGVHDLLKRCDKQLMGYEKKLKLIERFNGIREQTDRILALTDDPNTNNTAEIKEAAMLIRDQL